MFNSISQFISNKFNPGSPDCLLSIENTVNLRIAAAFVQASVGSIIPCLLHKTTPLINSSGEGMNYRGAYCPETEKAYGRGIAFKGSFFRPTQLNIGKVDSSGSLVQGYSYLKEKEITSQIAISNKSVMIANLEGQDGCFSRGVFQQEPKSLKSFPMPALGGEINGPIDDKRYLQGTFDYKGTFTGTITNSEEGAVLKGVFMKSELEGQFEQISGTREFTKPDGSKLIMHLPVNEGRFEGKDTFADGSVKEGVFRFDNDLLIQVSGTFDLKTGDSRAVGKMITETQIEARLSNPDGTYLEGVFDIGEKRVRHPLFDNQLSGTFKKILPDHNYILEGKILTPDTWEGKTTMPDGSIKEGVFHFCKKTGISTHISGTFDIKTDDSRSIGKIIDDTQIEVRYCLSDGSYGVGVFDITDNRKTCKFFDNQLSGTFKRFINNGSQVLEGKILSANTWEGTIQSNGSLQKGSFYVNEERPGFSDMVHLSGNFKNEEEKLEGEILDGHGTASHLAENHHRIFFKVDATKGYYEKSIVKIEYIKIGAIFTVAKDFRDTCAGTLVYPNGDYKEGLFTDCCSEEPTFLSGKFKKTESDGRIFEGTDDGKILEGEWTYPDGRTEYVIA